MVLGPGLDARDEKLTAGCDSHPRPLAARSWFCWQSRGIDGEDVSCDRVATILVVTPLSYAVAVASDATDDVRRRKAIEEELARIEESAKYSAQGQFEQLKTWRSVNLLLGVPGSLLAAAAGATGLAATAGRVTAGVLAILSAGFGAVLTTINASHHINQAASAANAYLEIQTAARQAREIDLPYMEIDEARQILAEVTARRDEQNKTAEAPNRRSYRRAQANIKRGGQAYEVDKGKGA